MRSDGKNVEFCRAIRVIKIGKDKVNLNREWSTDSSDSPILLRDVDFDNGDALSVDADGEKISVNTLPELTKRKSTVTAYFETPQANAAIAAVHLSIHHYSSRGILHIVNHTDDQGSADVNDPLSKARADAAAVSALTNSTKLYPLDYQLPENDIQRTQAEKKEENR